MATDGNCFRSPQSGKSSEIVKQKWQASAAFLGD
jgi:hypothetical protein